MCHRLNFCLLGQVAEDEVSDNSAECVVCLSDVRDTLILPCRHLCLCNTCADTLRYQANNCPICRLRKPQNRRPGPDSGVCEPTDTGVGVGGLWFLPGLSCSLTPASGWPDGLFPSSSLPGTASDPGHEEKTGPLVPNRL